mmetsp:Transcript_1304/g.2733  ORF Transcript_1304/g.2733 Transcript_1304/m.2733 type:complete len:97 (-) Transcript_1304:907-1197(-)
MLASPCVDWDLAKFQFPPLRIGPYGFQNTRVTHLVASQLSREPNEPTLRLPVEMKKAIFDAVSPRPFNVRFLVENDVATPVHCLKEGVHQTTTLIG